MTRITIAIVLLSLGFIFKSTASIIEEKRVFETMIYFEKDHKKMLTNGFLHRITDSGLYLITKFRHQHTMVKDSILFFAYGDISGIVVRKWRRYEQTQGILTLAAIGGNIYLATMIAPVFLGITVGVVGCLIAPLLVVGLYQALFIHPEVKVQAKTNRIDYAFATTRLKKYCYDKQGHLPFPSL